MRQLIVNADDFGFTRDVNAGIVEAHTRGILTATTLMANGDAFDDAVRLGREHPTLDIGCHMVLVSGRSVVDGGALPATVGEMMRAIVMGHLRPYAELRAQARRIFDAGIRPVHVDTHKHTHLFPPVLDAVARVAEEFDIPWVRHPFDFPNQPGAIPAKKRLVSRGIGVMRGHFRAVLGRRGRRSTDHFAGFQITGRFGATEVVQLIERLPEGSTEFMVHPGICTGELRAAGTRLKESRAEELRALTAPEVREALERCHVRLARYGELA